MIDLTQMEQGALENFLSAPGPLKSGLEKFTAHLAQEHNAMCAGAMGTVPRNPELAADHAAKAQLLTEFWVTLADVLTQSHVAEATAPVESL
jgi:hypothetical protein